MKLVVGLGNPGLRYRGTRHNLGFEVARRLARAWGVRLRGGRGGAVRGEGQVGSEQVLLLLPQTLMNLSGRAVGPVVRSQRVSFSDMLVVCDDLNLEVGRLRLRRRGSAGGHKGLASIIGALGSEEFARLRIGIGHPEPDVDAVQYVLSRPGRRERALLSQAVAGAAEVVQVWLMQGTDAAMQALSAATGAQGTASGRGQ